MAQIKYVSVDNLAKFKELYDDEISSVLSTEMAKTIKAVAQIGTAVYFYKEENPTPGTTTPAFTVNLPDVSGFMNKIASAAGSKVVVSKADGTVEESSIAISDVATKTYADTAVSTAISGLADVASSGAAEDVSYDNTTSGLTATDVQAAIDEVAEASAGGVDSKTVYLQDESAGQSSYAKVYKLYQGADSSDMTENTLVGAINIPKDLVVQSGKVVTVENGVDSDGDTTTVADGTYIKLVVQNQTAPIYINVADLVDAYTPAQNATQVQVAISGQNVISATIVAGSIGTTELANGGVTKAKLASGVQDSLDLADSALQSTDFETATNADIEALFA